MTYAVTWTFWETDFDSGDENLCHATVEYTSLEEAAEFYESKKLDGDLDYLCISVILEEHNFKNN